MKGIGDGILWREEGKGGRFKVYMELGLARFFCQRIWTEDKALWIDDLGKDFPTSSPQSVPQHV